MMRTDAVVEAQRRILLVQHPVHQHGFYDVVLDWLDKNLPQVRGRFDLQPLHDDLVPSPGHTLLVPWLQDPVQDWSEAAYAAAAALEARCDAAGIAVVNRVTRLHHAGKSEGAARMRLAGLRTPRMVPVQDATAFRADGGGLDFPLLVREDWGHGGWICEVRDAAGLAGLSLAPWRRPVAGEMILLPDPQDGLFRKYRYVVAGERGVPHHLQASQEWVTRGDGRVTNERTRQEELDYIGSPSPHHALFVAACRHLGLDFVAFDYGLDTDGRPVVWEANPFPYLQFSRTTLVYRNDAMHRTIAVMVALYLERAGIAVPPPLLDYLASCPCVRQA